MAMKTVAQKDAQFVDENGFSRASFMHVDIVRYACLIWIK